ncbi:hypothetical protein CVT25_008435 [Psilocybe cyanescens]|uniref:Uncharacterized protein n=1 Tax=Psilocybe cyanescens TaxID=93625 RepID=A0A409WUT5_PSICY|nr:hypothetical protein CVT25_008435 [Psilocybe cyanescens]
MSQASRVETAGNAEKFLLTSLHYGHQHKTPHNNAAVHSPFHYLTLHIPSSMAISNTHTDYAAAGIATITAVAAVGNPRNIPGSKKVMLDVQVFVGSPSCESLLGALAYFNGSNMVFDHDSVALYLIYATVIIAKFEEGAVVHPTHPELKYDFIGDIQWIIPLSPPSSDSNVESSSFAIDPCQRAYLHISGVASNSQKSRGTFDVDIEHYISTFKDAKVGSKPMKPIAPISCIIPDSPRYIVHGKPVPYNKRYVSVSGFLSGVTYKPDSPDVVQRFHLEVENIAFLGQQGNSSGSPIPNSLDTPVKTPRATKGLINYNRKSPAPPTTPTPSQGPPQKRRRIQSDSSSDTLPSQENVPV